MTLDLCSEIVNEARKAEVNPHLFCGHGHEETFLSEIFAILLIVALIQLF
jgi:hypothetical protein